MNALTAVHNNAVDSGQDYSGFTLIPSAQSPRLLELTFTEQTTKQFLEQVAEWPVQALEYKSFLRFRVGKILDDLCANQLQPLLLKTLLNRAEGALLINAVGIDDVAQADEMVKLATAVAHLIGRSNFDAMAQFCLAGNRATKAFCDQNGIRYDNCGKMLVATSELEMERMRALWERTAANGIEREWLNAVELREREPNITGLGGIFVPSSGIVSYREVTAAMAKIFQARGGEIIYNAEVSALSEHKNGVVVRTRQGGEYEASTLISCSGLMADRLVKMLGLEPGFIICPFRGEYFRLAPEHNQIVNHLIYPIPDPAMPFLGVHLTRMIDGSVTVGPNAVLAFKREGYRKRDFSFSDTLEILGSSGIRRVLQNHLRSGLGEMKNSLCKSGYLRLVQKYCPRLSLSDLQPWPAGVRAQAVSPDGKLIDDFLFVTTPRTIHTCNAPSPAATSAIPIGAHIVSKVQTLLASQSNPGRTLRAARSVDALHAAFNQ